MNERLAAKTDISTRKSDKVHADDSRSILDKGDQTEGCSTKRLELVAAKRSEIPNGKTKPSKPISEAKKHSIEEGLDSVTD